MNSPTSPNSPPEITEVERIALQAIIDVRHRAATSFDEGFAGIRGQAYDRAVLDCHDAVRAAIEALQTKPELPSEIEGLAERLEDAGAYCGALSDVNHLFGEAAQVILSLQRRLAVARNGLDGCRAYFEALEETVVRYPAMLKLIDAALNPKEPPMSSINNETAPLKGETSNGD